PRRPPATPPPLPRPTFADEDPDEPEALPPRRPRRTSVQLILAGLAGLLLLLGGGATLAYFLWPKGSEPDNTSNDMGGPTDASRPKDRLEDPGDERKEKEPEPEKASPAPKGSEPAGPPVVVEPAPVRVNPKDGGLPSPLSEDREERTLPEAAGDICAGGAGRYLILGIPKVRKLGVFDAATARVVKYLPLVEEGAKFAAGRDALIVVAPNAGVIERYSLNTLEKEVTAPLPYAGKLHAVLMGSATNGPVLIGMSGMTRERASSTYVFFDPKTLKELVYDWQGDGPDRDRNIGFNDTTVVSRLSADGRILTWWLPGLSSGQYSMVIEGNRLKGPFDGGQNGYALPGPGGDAVFTPGRVLSTEMKPAGPEAKSNSDGGTYYLPAANGRWYLAIQRGRRRGAPSDAPLEVALDLHLQGADRPLASFRDLKGLDLPEAGIQHGPDQWFHFVPDAKMLVTLTPARDKLVVYKLDIEAALEKSDTDYLVVTSTAPASATRGKSFTYPIAVKARRGGVKIKLDAGTPGMKVDAEGVLTWEVPRDFTERDVSIILTVSDATGQEVFHTFRLVVD
ncbi:MAG TPA: hypothetical protein VKE40_24490, partial [Gemmataceae bacterium]|nr:hypothetical protein [Gemmataceae bacterium]